MDVSCISTVGPALSGGECPILLGSKATLGSLSYAKGCTFHAGCGGSKSEGVSDVPGTNLMGSVRSDAGRLIGGPIDRSSKCGVVIAALADAGCV